VVLMELARVRERFAAIVVHAQLMEMATAMARATTPIRVLEHIVCMATDRQCPS
jgi:hypothetical protein